MRSGTQSPRLHETDTCGWWSTSQDRHDNSGDDNFPVPGPADIETDWAGNGPYPKLPVIRRTADSNSEEVESDKSSCIFHCRKFHSKDPKCKAKHDRKKRASSIDEAANPNWEPGHTNFIDSNDPVNSNPDNVKSNIHTIPNPKRYCTGKAWMSKKDCPYGYYNYGETEWLPAPPTSH